MKYKKAYITIQNLKREALRDLLSFMTSESIYSTLSEICAYWYECESNKSSSFWSANNRDTLEQAVRFSIDKDGWTEMLEESLRTGCPSEAKYHELLDSLHNILTSHRTDTCTD